MYCISRRFPHPPTVPLLPNALLPNALLPTALLPNALLPNALLPNALLPNALYYILYMHYALPHKIRCALNVH